MSMNPLRLLSRNHDAEFAAAVADELTRPALPPLPMIDKAQNSVTKALEQARDRQTRLEREIAERTEDLRQTVVVIEAFEASEKVLVAGKDDDARLELPKRRVRVATRAEAEAATIADADGKLVSTRDDERRIPRPEAAE